MRDYLLHILSWEDFEGLVVRICHRILGTGTFRFSSGPDGGRDGRFEGTASSFPSPAEPWSGRFVIQAKHTQKSDASCSDRDFARLLKEELPKVRELRKSGQCDCYLLFTNRKLTAGKEEELVPEMRRQTGVERVAILGRETITTWLEGAPEVAEAAGLWVSPLVRGRPTIPPAKRDFTGRTEERADLRREIGAHGGALIYGVRGLGGVGKTELAYKLVEEVGAEYPDGQVLVELGGASDRPLTVTEAMAELIRAFEPQVRLPDGEAELRRIYHGLLRDRRAVVLLDDAASAEQVEPLLPHAGCLTLVTSRQRFALPDLYRQDLDALSAEAARELLLRLAPRLGEAAEEIAGLLGRLPLALRLAGSAFAERPGLEPAEYLRRLASREERVGLVAAVIDFSYRALPSELRRRWRMLAVFPGGFDAAGAGRCGTSMQPRRRRCWAASSCGSAWWSIATDATACTISPATSPPSA